MNIHLTRGMKSLARIIHDGSSRKRVPGEVEDICRSDEFRTFNRSSGQQIPELLHERRFTRKSGESAIAAEVFMNNAG